MQAFIQIVGVPFVNSDMLGNNGVYKRFFSPAMCCAASVNVLMERLLFMQSPYVRLFIFRKATRRRCLPFGFPRAKIGLAYLLNGKVVILAFICKKANSTLMSSFQLIGMGRL